MSLGILSGCVFIWSCIHTWNESKRCGRTAIDLWTVGQFTITCCSHFANMIFAVCLLLAIHTLVFYKAQSVVYILLPSQDLEVVVNRYVAIAFILKVCINNIVGYNLYFLLCFYLEKINNTPTYFFLWTQRKMYLYFFLNCVRA